MKQIPFKPDQIVLELLARVNILLSHANMHSEHQSDIDSMIAIHDLDNSVEFILNILEMHLEIGSTTGKNLNDINFPQMVAEFNKFLIDNYKWPLPNFSDIKRLHQIRNLVQHGAVNPSTDLKRWKNIVNNFFEKILRRIFNINREAISISLLIKNNDLQKIYRKIEEYLNKKEYLKAIIASRDTFENIIYHRKSNSNILFDFVPAFLEIKNMTKYSSLFLEKIVDNIEMTKMGIDMARYDRFQQYLRYIPSKYNLENSGHSILGRDWTYEDVNFCFSFVTDVILKFQNEDYPPISNYGVHYFDDYKFSEKIGNINLSEEEHVMSYLFGDETQMKLSIVNQQLKEKLEKLKIGNIYTITSKRFKNNKLEHHTKYHIVLKSIYSKVITNNPPRWYLFIWYTSNNDYIDLLENK